MKITAFLLFLVILKVESKRCSSQNDCSEEECCSRRYGFDRGRCRKKIEENKYCMPYIPRLIYSNVYMFTCPCKEHLKCTHRRIDEKGEVVMYSRSRCIGPHEEKKPEESEEEEKELEENEKPEESEKELKPEVEREDKPDIKGGPEIEETDETRDKPIEVEKENKPDTKDGPKIEETDETRNKTIEVEKENKPDKPDMKDGREIEETDEAKDKPKEEKKVEDIGPDIIFPSDDDE